MPPHLFACSLRHTNSLLSASLKKILNLNETISQGEHDDPHANGLAPVGPILNADGDPIWKVLVFDDLGRDVISSVLRVSDLRSMGVTMHMYVCDASLCAISLRCLGSNARPAS